MARWGLGIVSIGCIVMMMSQTMNENSGSLLYCLLGVLVVIAGFMLVYKDKKGSHSVKKQNKKR